MRFCRTVEGSPITNPSENMPGSLTGINIPSVAPSECVKTYQGIHMLQSNSAIFIDMELSEHETSREFEPLRLRR